MNNTRRDFFRLAAVPVAWRAFETALQAAAPRLPDGANESYWQMVRRQYPLEDGLLYLNAANVCPASRLVLDRHLEYLRDFHANPSFQNRDKYVAMRESLRDKLGRMLRVSPDEIALTRNTSEGSNVIVKGVDLKPGDEVLITDHNHPSNNDSWRVRAQRDGFVVKSLPVAIPAPGVEKILADFESAITSRTRVIAITHVTST
ncbi:MAG: aminotransferase class V-fold PLP-dependent enzyme, partial [Acidobacteria bacterium]|nr:aminotransferase class V-fold PLP-dependent enzyme [Acidobacteriota bacterium]